MELSGTEVERASERSIKQFVCFKLANEEYAVDIQLVQEVIMPPRITRIPQMPVSCLGVINNRGNIIPVFDLRKQFQLSDKPFAAETRFLVASIDSITVSFVVDQVLDNVRFDMSMVDPAPTVKMNIDRAYVQGLGEMEKRMIVILDIEKMHGAMVQALPARTQ